MVSPADVVARELPRDLSGSRVLDVGTGAGSDGLAFELRGASEVLACEPHELHRQAGRFDVVHCDGVLHRERDPLQLLRHLRAVLADDGLLLLGTVVLADLELADEMRFVPGSYLGDPAWWWVPGRVAIRYLLRAAGLRAQGEFGLAPGPPGEFPTFTVYIRAELNG